MKELTLENLLDYIDEAIKRQKFESRWVDDQYNEHITDVGYVCEGLELLKEELVRNFIDEDDCSKSSICDVCEIGDFWECQFCCAKCYEVYDECPNPDCDPMDI